MKPEQVTEALENVATQMGIKVRYESLPPGGTLPGGGLCRVRGEWNLIVDKKTTASERAGLLADALAGFDTDAVYLPPKVRNMLQSRRPTDVADQNAQTSPGV